MKVFISRKTIIFLLIIWLIVTGFNITKPIHFDDAPFLDMAQQIIKDPLHPFSQKTYFRGTPESTARTFYHPLLIPYLYALIIKLFGESELLLHIVFSFFSLGAIVFFYLLISIFSSQFSLLFTLLFALSPSFIPSQNLMTDIPLLLCFLAFFWTIFRGRFLFAGCVLGIALLIKYASLILIPILCIAILLKKKWHPLWVVSIPLIVIALWSLFNYMDYGGIHILSADKTPVAFSFSEILHKLVLWIMGVGSMTPYSILIFPFVLSKRRGSIILVGSIVFSLFTSFTFWRFPNEEFILWLLRFFFFANGILVFAIFPYLALQKIRAGEHNERYVVTLLFLWFFGVMMYLFYFVPFVAIRHILLTLPPFLLLLGIFLSPKHFQSLLTLFGIGITALLGMVLGISDYIQAEVYRTYPSQIVQHITLSQGKQEKNTQMWYTGNLDLQWYGGKAGMRHYDRETTVFEKGDFILVPTVILHEPYIAKSPILEKVYGVRVPSSWATLFRLTTDWPHSLSGYYAFFWETQLPWSISREPLEEFTVFIAKERGKI